MLTTTFSASHANLHKQQMLGWTVISVISSLFVEILKSTNIQTGFLNKRERMIYIILLWSQFRPWFPLE